MTTYLFIDGAYLRRNYADCVRPWFGSDGEIDFQQVKGGFGAERAFYYDALEDEQRPNESKEDCESRIANDEVFFNKIQELDGYFVRLGSLGGRRRNRRQKKVDILLVVEALDHAVRRNMDRAILLTGDRDFEPLVHSLVQLGVRVEVAGDRKTTSRYLRHAADIYKRLSFDDYHRWTIGSLRGQFPVDIGKTNRPPDNASAMANGLFGDKEVHGLHQQPDMFYIYVENFDRHGNDLTVAMDKFWEKLKLYFELQYGEIVWKN